MTCGPHKNEYGLNEYLRMDESEEILLSFVSPKSHNGSQ